MDIKKATREIFRKILPAIVLVALTAAALFWFFDSAKQSYRSGELQPHLRPEERSGGSAAPAVTIEPWMTFDYVNVVFGLQPSYLESTLGVRDPRYPNLSIDAYAKTVGVDPNAVVQEMTRAISGAQK